MFFQGEMSTGLYVSCGFDGTEQIASLTVKISEIIQVSTIFEVWETPYMLWIFNENSESYAKRAE